MTYNFFGGSKDGTEQEIDHQLRIGDWGYVPFDTGQPMRHGYDQEIYEFREPDKLHFLRYLKPDDLKS